MRTCAFEKVSLMRLRSARESACGLFILFAKNHFKSALLCRFKVTIWKRFQVVKSIILANYEQKWKI